MSKAKNLKKYFQNLKFNRGAAPRKGCHIINKGAASPESPKTNTLSIGDTKRYSFMKLCTLACNCYTASTGPTYKIPDDSYQNIFEFLPLSI